ncbi:MAG TPA: GNAT family N-acetyltransferase [Micromonosporaceae bacterium]|jgi:GNAT superfamily N-acetyltransferase|nr:GNAT family N-acetyltransferase [Micromonosporaceae bacterium]
MVRIRPYRPSDHSAGRGLWVELTEEQRELYDDATIGGADPGAAFEEYLTRLDLSGVWVADDGEGGVVGLVGLVLNGRAGEVEPVVVTRSRRGQGIGKTLLSHVAEEARKRGMTYLTITPSSRNEAAIRCFHAAGYDVMSAVELSLDLGRSTRGWQDGPSLQGLKFRY